MRHLGVPASGAADPLSMALANRLVGNPWHAAVLETTLQGPVLRFDADCSFAVTGALTEVTLNGEPVAQHCSAAASKGDTLTIGAARCGVRTYIAFTGGLQADNVLGSASTYLVAGFGGHEGRALAGNDYLPLLAPGTVADPVATPQEFRPPMTSSVAVRACEAAETQQLGDAGKAFFQSNWQIGQRADRMGMQLTGPAMQIASSGRMPSAAVFPGTVQCPENGMPFLLAIDAGTVGGYPRVAQVVRGDRHVLGQLKPGDHLRFLKRDPDDAVAELRAKLRYWRPWLAEIDQILL